MLLNIDEISSVIERLNYTTKLTLIRLDKVTYLLFSIHYLFNNIYSPMHIRTREYPEFRSDFR